MTFEEFQTSLDYPKPPENIPPQLSSLWYDAKGQWHEAHEIAQNIHSREGAWVHAYLHRKEGDRSNAGYWYRNAGKSFPDKSLEEEWKELVSTFLRSE